MNSASHMLAKVQKPSNPHLILQSSPVHQRNAFKIPMNHPLYRWNIIPQSNHLENLKVKQWKLHSLQIQGSRVDSLADWLIYHKFDFRIVRKSLSQVRTFKLFNWEKWEGNKSFWRLRLRCQSLEIENVSLTPRIAKSMMKVIHCGVKKMIFKPCENFYDESHYVIMRYCRKLERLNHWESLKPRMKKRIELPCLKKVLLREGRRECAEMNMFKHWPKVEEIEINFKPTSFRFPLKTLQNLQSLVLILPHNGKMINLDFSPFKACKNLKSLDLSLKAIKPLGLDELLHHLSLQEFSINQIRDILIEIDPKMNSLDTLQKLRLASKSDYNSYFNLFYYRHLLSKANKIRSLELCLCLAGLCGLISAEHTFALESFKIEIAQMCELPLLQSLVDFLKKQIYIRELDLHLQENNKKVLDQISKAISEKAPLEKLRIRLEQVRKGSPFLSVKKLIGRFLGLKELSLEMEQFTWNAREVAGFVGVLIKLKDLERFELKVEFVKLTDATFGKFMDFVRSIRHVKKLVINIAGCSEKQVEELKRLLLFIKLSDRLKRDA